MLVWIVSREIKGGRVLKSILKTSGCLTFLAYSALVSATGLGGINVSSNLGQPLKAAIELVSVDKTDRNNITAKLASADAFKNAGIEYPYSLPKLKFEVVNKDNGESFVNVTSGQAVNEPFVTLLVEVTWPSGKLMREYTFLLDPADYKAQVPKVEAVNQAEPVVVSPVVPVAVPVEIAAPAGAPVPDDIPLYSEPVAEVGKAEAPTDDIPLYASSENTTEELPLYASSDVATEEPLYVSSDAATEELPLYVSSDDTTGVEPSGTPADLANQSKLSKVDVPASAEITVKKGDTLTRIANQTKPADVSLERMLVALYRANTGAFEGKNMNRLKRGRIIRLPDTAELEAVKQREAVKEFHAQVADWNSYRQQLSLARTAVADHAGQQEVSGKVTTAVAESANIGKEAAKEVLKLSKGEAPDDKSMGAGKTSAQDKKNAIEEEEIAKKLAVKEAQDRAALLEKNVRDLQRLAELKKQVAAGQTEEVASAHVAGDVAGGSAVTAASAPVVAIAKTTEDQKVVTQPSLVDQLMSDPLMLAGGAALLLGLGGVGFVIARRGKAGGNGKTEKVEKNKPKKQYESEDAVSATGRIAAPTVSSPDTGDFTKTSVVDAPIVQRGSEEVDPIGEADLFLTFGRDAQAEEVLKEALSTNPGNTAVRLKLLSIYASRKDNNSFVTHARVIKESGDRAAWTQASVMGRELEPSNPLYGGESGGSTGLPSTGAPASNPAVDFDLGFGATITRTAPKPEYQTTVMMEAPSQESTDILTSDELRAAQLQTMDFDVSGAQPVMDFDVSGVIEGTNPNVASSQSPSSNFDDMVFDVTSTHSDSSGSSKTAPSKSASESVDDLIFDVTSNKPDSNLARTTPSATAVSPADSLAFTLDFPSVTTEATARKAVAPTDLSLGDINLNLDDLPPSASASAGSIKGENWQEVTTKLDLAKAYQEMGDAAGAKEILDEVLRDGDEKQRATAQAMLQQL